MTNANPQTNPSPTLFLDDAARWQALKNRNSVADGAFVYAVRTTGVYCRPTCTSRLAKRENIQFYATCEEAEQAGFRPCKRCHPNAQSATAHQGVVVAQACRQIAESESIPGLEELANRAGMSPSHFHRTFKAQTGLTPKQYARAMRSQQVRHTLTESRSVTEAIYQAGYQSTGRFYESATATLGMAPSTYRAGGVGETIRFAVGECWLGSILVAATAKGVCAIALGDDPDRLVRELQDRYPKSEFLGNDAEFQETVAQVVGLVESPSVGHHLPLDIHGTVFQERVWDALRKIPAGQTRSYAELAQHLGMPKAVRAVANACGANPLAIAIPCHRVVRTGGLLSGYRWGIDRKLALLQRERAE